MIAAIVFMAVHALPSHPRERPITAVEWADHYDYCLHTNASTLLNEEARLDRTEAARRAVVRCWPVRASARSKIIAHLANDGRHNNAADSHEIAERLLDNTAKAFAADFNLTLAALGPLDAR